MRIQELAGEHGITPATLRLYERRGLLDDRHLSRRANGYREYTDAANQRVGIIRLGQLAGFSLKQLREGLDRWEDESLPDAERAAILDEQLCRVDEQLRQILATRDYLVAKLHSIGK